MGVDIDETRRHDLSLGVDLPGAFHTVESADGGDSVAGDGDIGLEAGRAVARDHRRLAQDEIMRHRRILF